MKLHHRSKRYEVQERQPHTLSWKPIAHADNEQEAIETMLNAQRRKAGTYRVLDRQHGASSAHEIAKVTGGDEPYKAGTLKVKTAKRKP